MICYTVSMNVNLQIPDDLYEKLVRSNDMAAVLSTDTLVIKASDSTNNYQNTTIRWLLLPALISGIIAWFIFIVNHIRLVPLVSDAFSISEVGAFLGVASGLISFVVTITFSKGISKFSIGRLTRIRNFITLTIAHTILLYAFY